MTDLNQAVALVWPLVWTMIKIVVTGDDGRYVLPQLPTATYNVWVRGYGLVDSPKVDGEPGKPLTREQCPAAGS